ncbi:MAG: cation:proton antiporter [Candidatus Rokubacteria bacterium]|nr:cation:proton antiporter [Candidatus Rokubacteria bacterium]
MTGEALFFRDLAWVFAAAVVGGGLAWLTRQPLILGYVVGGILIGPFTPGPTVSDLRTFEVFAEVGVVLLMFSIGIEFSLHDLLRVKWVALLGGPAGIVLSIALGHGVGLLLGWPPLQGIVVGTVVSVASTMVLARLLLDRGELHTRHGRIMIGITLVEDLAVVVLIVLMPAVGVLGGDRALALGLGLAKSALILVPFGVVAARVAPAILARVARTRSDELFLLVALALALGTAALTQAAGLSLALGAFLAGLVVSESDYAHEALARLLPLRDAFVALFFVTVGALINPATVWANLPLLGAVLGLVLVGNLAIWTTVVWLFGHPLATAFRVGAGLTQIGEFSYVLVQAARTAGHVGDDVYNAVLAASLLTILANAALVRAVPGVAVGRTLAPGWSGIRLTGGPDALAGHAVLCGFGRVGGLVGEALETFGVPYVAIERDPDIAADLRARGVVCLFGDAAQPHLLAKAGVERAALVVVALPEIDRAQLAVRAARALNGSVPVLARAHRGPEAERLREVGATEVIEPELETSATLIRHALRRLALPDDAALAYLSRLREAVETGAGASEGAPARLPEVRELGPAGARLDGCSLRSLRLRERFGVTVVAIVRADGETVHGPGPDAVVRAGDTLHVFGLARQVDAFRAEML